MKLAHGFALLLVAAAPAQAEWQWRDLWQTPDQQGQRLLDTGHADAAAKTFRDPARRGYAAARAGDDARAARTLQGMDSAQAQYNRGNALARLGDLANALKAYDAALAKDPGMTDARHNRELVERALKNKTPQHDSSASGLPRQPASSGNTGARSAE